MKILQNNDYNLLKIFKNHKEAPFVNYFHISYEMDYYYILVNEMLKNKLKLAVSLNTNWNKDKWNEICKYIEQNGSFEDKKYFALVEVVMNIAKKYYNMDGTAKEKIG